MDIRHAGAARRYRCGIDKVERGEAVEIEAEVKRRLAIDIRKPHVEDNLGFDGRDGHVQQVDHLAKRRRNGSGTVGCAQVFDRTAEEGRVVLEVHADILAGEVTRQFGAHGIDLARALTHREIVEEPITALLPDDDGGLAGQEAVDEQFLGTDSDCFRQGRVCYRHALDIHGAVDHQRLAYGHGEVLGDQAGCFLQRGAGAGGLFGGGIVGAQSRRQPSSNEKSYGCYPVGDHCFSSVNFCSALRLPWIISMTKGCGFGSAR